MRVVIADDSVLLREGAVRLLDDAGFDVVGQAGDGEDLLCKVCAHKPDVAVVDIRMPPTHVDEGLQAAKVIRSELPDVGVLVLSQYVEERYAIELLADGAEGVGYLLKDRIAEVDRFVEAVRRVGEGGSVLKTHELPFTYSMLLPAFRGVEAVRGIDGLTNPRGFILVDKYQRNPKFPDIFGIGVCVAIPPVGKTAVPVGVPKTGFMIESMVAATTHNIERLINGAEPDAQATWNAICLADMGDSGIAFVAQPQIPPRNVNWAAEGKWVHAAKIGFEKYFLGKMRSGRSEPFYEHLALQVLGIDKLKAIKTETAK